MAKKHRNRSARRSPHRTATRRAEPRGRSADRDRIQDMELIQTLRRALRSPDPTDFLLTAAPIAQVVTDGDVDADLPEGWVGLLDSFCEVDIAETTALLHVIAALTRDDLVRARLRKVLETRRQPIPGQVRTLSEVEVEGTMLMGGDPAGDNIIVGLSWPTGEAATMVAYLSRFPDVYLKDAFFIGDRLENVLATYRQIIMEQGEGPQNAPQPFDPAEARAALERGLAGHDAMPEAPGPEEDEGFQQWPLCRALVEHVVTLLPTGGRGYDDALLLPGQDPELLDRDFIPSGDPDEDEIDYERIEQLAEEFMGSSHARHLPDDGVTQRIVTDLLLLAATAEGDPLHWCPNVLEWVLTSALVLHPLMDEESLERAVDLLPDLVTWAGEASGEDPDVARALTEMVPAWSAQLWATRNDPEVIRQRARVEAQLLLERGDYDTFLQLALEEHVGGAQALADLDAEPLPAEDLDLDRLPEDVRERAREVDEVLTRTLETLAAPHLDVEFLTACRRFLARAVERDPAVLRRRARADTTAAAIAWTVGRTNGLIGYSPAPVRTSGLMDAFGLSSPPSGRADTLKRAFGAPEVLVGTALGDARVLVASRRAELIERRDLPPDQWAR